MAKDKPLIAQDFLDSLHQAGLIDEAQYNKTKMRVRSGPASAHPITQIAELDIKSAKPPHPILTAEYLTEYLAQQVKLPYMRVDPLKVDVDSVTDVMSKAFAERHKILAVAVTDETVTVATAEPEVTSWMNGLSHVSRKDVKRVIVNPLAIERFQREFYSLSHSVKGAKAEGRKESSIGNLEQLIELGKLGDVDANDQHVVRIVDWLLQYAFDQRASDIHIEPRREVGNVRFRIDGVLHKVYELPSQITTAVTSRLKILGRMDVAEKRKPLDGRIKTKSPNGDEVELRISTLPTAFGEKLVARIFDPTVLVRPFVELGLEPKTEKDWLDMVGQPTGIVLVTGPTGSGKTTTLYTTLKQLAKPEVNVCTIEDPIEMVEPAFNQMQVHHDIDLDFASGVRALLRQDPDIIMIGEIRDRETADMAVQAALTGHLVISTLHTNDAPSAITRMIEVGVAPYLINATVLGIMAQRLVRILCDNCKQPVKPDPTKWNAMVAPFSAKIPDTIFAPKGCDECRNTGFRGRQGIYELLNMSGTIQGMIKADTDLGKIRKQALKEGMNLLRISGARKVANGLTTIEEVMRVAPQSRDE